VLYTNRDATVVTDSGSLTNAKVGTTDARLCLAYEAFHEFESFSSICEQEPQFRLGLIGDASEL
jgi:hypothetical protein